MDYSTETPLASALRDILDCAYAEGIHMESWVKNSPAPPSITILLEFITKEFWVKRSGGEIPRTEKNIEALKKYRKYFLPGSLVFEFPPKVSTRWPSPYYAAVEGKKIFYVDWQLSHGLVPNCPNCKCELKCNRSSFRENGSLMPMAARQLCNLWREKTI